jgi:hypothetical protein
MLAGESFEMDGRSAVAVVTGSAAHGVANVVTASAVINRTSAAEIVRWTNLFTSDLQAGGFGRNVGRASDADTQTLRLEERTRRYPRNL